LQCLDIFCCYFKACFFHDDLIIADIYLIVKN